MPTAPKSSVASFALGAALLALGGCKKDEPVEQAAPTASAESPTTVAPDPTAAAPEADAAANAAAEGDGAPDAAATAEAPAAPAGGGASIEACCNALAAIQKSGRDDVAKKRAEAGATMCKGIAPLVKSGKTPRSKALTQVRSALQGITIPGECR